MSKISANLITKSIYRLIRTFVKSTQNSILWSWKYFYSLAPIFLVSTKCIDPWVLELVVSNITGKSMGKLYFVWFLFSWFKWTTKSVKIRTTRIIMISQYMYIRSVFTCRQFHCVHIYLALASNSLFTILFIDFIQYRSKIYQK
jgi:hypothetical protein